jgi:hypothetical protein
MPEDIPDQESGITHITDSGTIIRAGPQRLTNNWIASIAGLNNANLNIETSIDSSVILIAGLIDPEPSNHASDRIGPLQGIIL